MYPKQSVFSSASNSTRQNKREQLTRLLINRFRLKYNINFNQNPVLDQKIVDTVNAAVKTGDPLGEKNLVMLSRKIGQVVEDYRINKKQVQQSTTSSQQVINHFFDQDDLKSEKASQRLFTQKAAARPRDHSAPLIQEQQDDIPKIINAMTVNKGIGMTDAEWNDIVRRNAVEEQLQADHEKQKVQKQKEQLKLELDLQMQKRKEADLTFQLNEREVWKSQVNFLEQKKQIEEARRATFKAGYLNGKVNMLDQLQTKFKEREAQLYKEKETEKQERIKLDEERKQAEQFEIEKKLQMKAKLINLKEEDRKMRLDFYSTQKVPQQEDTFMVKRFFDRAPHQSFKLRAKNDAVTSYISEKFKLATPRTKSIERPNENIAEKRSIQAQQKLIEHMESRKKKEFEVARVLDWQVERKQTEVQKAKQLEQEIGTNMAKDVELHLIEEMRSKQERIEKNMKYKKELVAQLDQRQKINEYLVTCAAYKSPSKTPRNAEAEITAAEVEVEQM